MAKERFILEIEAGRDPLNREPHVALRQWLKLGLRAFGLKCITVSELNPEPVPPQPPKETP